VRGRLRKADEGRLGGADGIGQIDKGYIKEGQVESRQFND